MVDQVIVHVPACMSVHYRVKHVDVGVPRMSSSASAKSGERRGPARRAAPFGNFLVPGRTSPTSNAPLRAPAVPSSPGTPTSGAALCGGELKCQEILIATWVWCQ